MYNEQTWKEGELIAQKYMESIGYKIMYTNFSCVGVELDIVAILPKRVQIKKLKQEYKQKIKNAKLFKTKQILRKSFKNFAKTLNDLVVITEVKARRSGKFGNGADAVNESKQMHIKRGAEYISKMSQFKDMLIRFDVASVDSGKITYIEGAF